MASWTIPKESPNESGPLKGSLQTYPEYNGRISMIVQAIPSGETSESFFNLKSQVDELVGRINGNYGTITWTPVRYLNQSFTYG